MREAARAAARSGSSSSVASVGSATAVDRAMALRVSSSRVVALAWASSSAVQGAKGRTEGSAVAGSMPGGSP